MDAATIKSWMSVSENGDISFSEEHIADWIAGLAEKYDTFGKDVSFQTSLGQTITVNSLDYGWQMDQEGEKSKLRSYLDSGESVLTEPLWLKMGVSLGGNGIGSTYVEIDYTNQRMWFYKDGALLVDTLVVTGNVSRDMASPEGIFGLYYKETNATLKGEDYKTPVDFWMPFYGGVGIHDAKWRSSFGGNLYQTEGSHGCINTPWENAKTIFENIEPGTPSSAILRATIWARGRRHIPSRLRPGMWRRKSSRLQQRARQRPQRQQRAQRRPQAGRRAQAPMSPAATAVSLSLTDPKDP